jgi:hypothetical protein
MRRFVGAPSQLGRLARSEAAICIELLTVTFSQIYVLIIVFRVQQPHLR